MVYKKLFTVFVFSLFQIFLLGNLWQFNSWAYVKNKNFESHDTIKKPIPNEILEKFDRVRNLFKEVGTYNIFVAEEELFVIIKEQNVISAYLLIFNTIKTESRFKEIEAIATKLWPEFIKGDTSNVKKLFWLDNNGSYSWSPKTEINKEKICDCGCAEGRFSLKLCIDKSCPIKRDSDSNQRQVRKLQNGN